MKIYTNQGLAYSGFEQLGPGLSCSNLICSKGGWPFAMGNTTVLALFIKKMVINPLDLTIRLMNNQGLELKISAMTRYCREQKVHKFVVSSLMWRHFTGNYQYTAVLNNLKQKWNWKRYILPMHKTYAHTTHHLPNIIRTDMMPQFVQTLPRWQMIFGHSNPFS